MPKRRAGDVPGWVRRFVEVLLPAAYGQDVVRDLAEDEATRGISGRWARQLWYLRQVGAPTMLLLIWRLRRQRATERLPSGLSAWRTATAQAARGLRRSPLFTLASVSSLGLGIGATAAILNVADAVLLRPPPYEAPDELVFVWNRLDGFESNRLPLSGVQVAELRRERSVFADVAGIWATTRTVSFEDGAILVPAATVTPNFLEILGVEPALGRGFHETEGEEGEATVLVSHAFWERELGADPDAVGRSLRVEGSPAVVVGVLPPDLRLVFSDAVGVPSRVDLFTVYPWIAAENTGGPRFLRVVARLRPGVGVQAADRAVQEVSRRLRATYEHMAASGDLFSAVPIRSDAVRATRPLLLVLIAGVAIFLLLACVNVTSLLLARSTARNREFAVRRCLGASSRSLTRLLLAEVGLLTGLGAVVGTGLGAWGLALLWRVRPGSLARIEDISLDPQVIAATLVVVVLTGGFTALAPFFGRHGSSPADLLRGASTLGSRSLVPRRVVVAGELALSVVLVVGAVLLGRSLDRVQSVDLGFEPEQVMTFRVGISNRTFPTDVERARLGQSVEEAVASIPGVENVGATSHIPLADWANWSGSAAPVTTPEAEVERFHFDHRSVTPGYFSAIGARLLRGRDFRVEDTGASDPVVIVDEVYADRVFPGKDVVGRQIVATRYVERTFVPTTATVVGVVASLRDRDPSTAAAGQVFWPWAQSARWELTYAARVSGEGDAWAELFRTAVAGVHHDLAVADVRPASEYVDNALAPLRFASLLGSVFSALAIVLAAVGLHGVVSYATRQRVGEIGIRLALGARGRRVFGTVLTEGLAIAAAGVGVGLVGAGLLTRFLESLLFEVDPLDVRVFAVVGAGLLGVAVVAALVPAVRAARLDPVETLRRS